VALFATLSHKQCVQGYFYKAGAIRSEWVTVADAAEVAVQAQVAQTFGMRILFFFPVTVRFTLSCCGHAHAVFFGHSHAGNRGSEHVLMLIACCPLHSCPGHRSHVRNARARLLCHYHRTHDAHAFWLVTTHAGTLSAYVCAWTYSGDHGRVARLSYLKSSLRSHHRTATIMTPTLHKHHGGPCSPDPLCFKLKAFVWAYCQLIQCIPKCSGPVGAESLIPVNVLPSTRSRFCCRRFGSLDPRQCL
jgi:hypothetical protein